ncbi:MAG: cellulose synthase complex periplasmic endoglucanase BcsZ [Polyangiales bacterium]
MIRCAPALLWLVTGCVSGAAVSGSPQAPLASRHFGAGTSESPEAAALAAARASVVRAQQDESYAAPITPTTEVQPTVCAPWPLWQRYAEHFISSDGRVIDRSDRDRTTSEGQAYGMFFALIAGDRERFAELLAWTERNLAQGSLREHLPAWHWGQRPEGGWGVVDPNAASDADVFIAYTLLEAARAWQLPEYRALGLALAARIANEEVIQVAGLGAVLLPGPQGFVGEQGAVRLNPSYLVLPVLRKLAAADPSGRFAEVVRSSRRVLLEAAPGGLMADWVRYTPGIGFGADEAGALGSYDAIRVYLWSAFLPESEPERASLTRAADSFNALVARIGRVPEKIGVAQAEVSEQDGPPGFWAVAFASAKARGDHTRAAELADRLDASRAGGLYGTPPAYYDQNLALFALGFTQARYRFRSDGSLQLPWEVRPCHR